MEQQQKKFDPNTLIGLLLIGLIFFWFMNKDAQKRQTELEQEKAEQKADSIQKAQNPTTKIVESESLTPVSLVETSVANTIQSDSLTLVNAKSKLGAFVYSATLASAKDETTTIENEVLKLVVANKGGEIVELEVKDFKTHHQTPLYIVKDHNANLKIDFSTLDNRILSTENLYFEPTLTKNGDQSILSMKLKTSPTSFLEYRYVLKPNEYMIDFKIKSQGLQNVINSSKPIDLTWDTKTIHTEKSVKYANQYTALNYKFDDGFDHLSITTEDDDEVKNVKWIAYTQQFFTSILSADTPISSVKIKSENLVEDDKIDTLYIKRFTTTIPLEMKGGDLDYNWNYYYGPSDYNRLLAYKDLDLEHSVNYGWGIFRWINKYAINPIFNLLKGNILSFGLIIILMTIIIRLFMSPLVYKSYLASAKMKVLRPEMEEINKRMPGKENAMKRQQETMALQRKAGVSMLSGCIPALLQMPVFFALFRFFPSNFDLRQKGFLWANDLSAYDDVLQLPFDIPVYGSHVSLFPLLASIAIFFYMQMSQSQQANMQAPTQEGMPDMQKMMKIMLYISPVMMLFFFNQYGSGLSLYYFISNVLTLSIMYVIKTWVIDEDKVHAMVEKKKKQEPKKKSAFRQRIDTAMKQAQEQQELKKKSEKKKK